MEKEDTEKSWETDKMSRRSYRACINETRIEEMGVQPLLDTLEKLGGWPVLQDGHEQKDYESFKWYDQVQLLNKEGLSFNYIMSLYIDADDKNNSYRVFKLDQTNLGMYRDYLIKGFDDEQVQHYYQYMIDAEVLLGADETKAKEQLKDSLLFEISLASISAPGEERRDNNKLYNPTTLGELDSVAHKAEEPAHPPSWQKYVASLVRDGIHYKEETEVANQDEDIVIKEDEKVILRDPVFFKKLPFLILKTNPKVIANYMAWRVVQSRIKYLNKAAQDIRQKYIKARTGIVGKEPTWKKCVGATDFNSMYVREYFKPEAKKEMLIMISYIRASFGKLLDEITWMDNETKTEAKRKLEKMDQFIAYPDELLDQNIVDGLNEGIIYQKRNFLNHYFLDFY